MRILQHIQFMLTTLLASVVVYTEPKSIKKYEIQTKARTIRDSVLPASCDPNMCLSQQYKYFDEYSCSCKPCCYTTDDYIAGSDSFEIVPECRDKDKHCENHPRWSACKKRGNFDPGPDTPPSVYCRNGQTTPNPTQTQTGTTSTEPTPPNKHLGNTTTPSPSMDNKTATPSKTPQKNITSGPPKPDDESHGVIIDVIIVVCVVVASLLIVVCIYFCWCSSSGPFRKYSVSSSSPETSVTIETPLLSEDVPQSPNAPSDDILMVDENQQETTTQNDKETTTHTMAADDKKTTDSKGLMVDESFNANIDRMNKALQWILIKALPAIAHKIQMWHQIQKLKLKPCDSQCPSNPTKKPKLGRFCQNCVDWVDAIQSAYYPPIQPDTQNMHWRNASPSQFHQSYIEVAKTFVIRLPSPGTCSYTILGEFDAACLLQLMMHFTDFHGGDASMYKKIKDVYDIRNELSHMEVIKNMCLGKEQLDEYFEKFIELAECLIEKYPDFLHPDLFSNIQKLQQFSGRTADEVLQNHDQMIGQVVQNVSALQKGYDYLIQSDAMELKDRTDASTSLQSTGNKDFDQGTMVNRSHEANTDSGFQSMQSSPESHPSSIQDFVIKICTEFASDVNGNLHKRFQSECDSPDEWKEALLKEALTSVQVDLDRFPIEDLSSNPASLFQVYSKPMGGAYGAQSKEQEFLSSLNYMKNCRAFHSQTSNGSFQATLDKVLALFDTDEGVGTYYKTEYQNMLTLIDQLSNHPEFPDRLKKDVGQVKSALMTEIGLSTPSDIQMALFELQNENVEQQEWRTKQEQINTNVGETQTNLQRQIDTVQDQQDDQKEINDKLAGFIIDHESQGAQEVSCGSTLNDLTSSSQRNARDAMNALSLQWHSADGKPLKETLYSLVKQHNPNRHPEAFESISDILEEVPDLSIAVLASLLLRCTMYEAIGKVSEWHGKCPVCSPIFRKALDKLHS